jgi:hypothetical protein
VRYPLAGHQPDLHAGTHTRTAQQRAKCSEGQTPLRLQERTRTLNYRGRLGTSQCACLRTDWLSTPPLAKHTPISLQSQASCNACIGPTATTKCQACHRVTFAARLLTIDNVLKASAATCAVLAELLVS